MLHFVFLNDRTINLDGIEEIFWSSHQERLIGCHIYYKSGRHLDLNQIQAGIVMDCIRRMYSNTQETDVAKKVVTGALK